MASKTCIACGGTWPIAFFYSHGNGKKRARCIGCNRKTDSQTYLLTRKAHNSIVRHAKNRGISKTEFTNQFGWTTQRMAEDLHLAGAGKCPYCLEHAADFKSLTFDVIDPIKPPHYSANVRICCDKCNVAKKNMSPEAWAERLDTWIKYREWIDKIKNNPVLNLPLFQNL